MKFHGATVSREWSLLDSLLTVSSIGQMRTADITRAAVSATLAAVLLI
jgi:hypothetical protein